VLLFPASEKAAKLVVNDAVQEFGCSAGTCRCSSMHISRAFP